MHDGIQGLFPADVVAVAMGDAGDVSALLPEEAACLGRSVPKRAQEFAAGRLCARRALLEFGVVNFPLRVGPQREPLWPEGYVGSITHTTGLCAAVVAERARFSAIGVDVEIADRVKQQLWPHICVAAEIAWLDSLPESQRVAAATLIFAAKEAFYKAQFPLVGERLDFHDVCVEASNWNGTRGACRLRPLRPLMVSAFVTLPLLAQYRYKGEFVAAGVIALASNCR